MGIGESILKELKNNLPQAMELYDLIKQQPVRLNRLDISEGDFTEILQSYHT